MDGFNAKHGRITNVGKPWEKGGGYPDGLDLGKPPRVLDGAYLPPDPADTVPNFMPHIFASLIPVPTRGFTGYTDLLFPFHSCCVSSVRS